MENRLNLAETAENAVGIALDLLPVICAIFIISWAGRAYAEGKGLFVQRAKDDFGDSKWRSEVVEITEQDTLDVLQIGKMLKSKGLITSGTAFAVKARLSGYSGAIRPGVYHFSSDMTMEQMLSQMSAPAAGEKSVSGGDASAPVQPAEQEDSSVKENKDVWGQ